MNNTTDAQLIRLAADGDRLAAGRLAERHRKRVFQIAWQALGNVDDAADVAQETLVYALLRIGDLRDPNTFSEWLRQVTLSHCVDYRRRRGTRRLGEPITVLNEAGEESRYLERLMVREALSHLSAAHRTALLLHYEGGWSLEETAVLLQIPLNTVRSRLMAAKRHLRADLQIVLDTRKTMLTETSTLTQSQLSLLNSAFPGARTLSIENDPEPWMPFAPRVRLALADGTEKTVDFRRDIDPEKARLISVLDRLGIPGPRILHGPVPALYGDSYLTLCETPRGENLLLWTLGGTPHRVRLATERAFEAIDRLQGITEALLADPVGASLPRRTLLEEIDLISSDAKWNADPWLAEAGKRRHAWHADPWFQAALAKMRAAAEQIKDPLVFTNYLHFFPNWLRIEPANEPFNEPLGWPGDTRYRQNPIVEFVTPFGHFGDPLLGLAMVWVYDCYPFVHTGFVEQFLWRRGVSRREFAPRLAIKGLQMIARDLPVERPEEGEYWDSLRGWVEQALIWM
ncbi:MAG: polymerase sigma-70 factor [Chthonomonadaceae bacterium]|nr:polymerase sigma-70 factor [Chthonomonadaceae bacterium]